MLGFVLRGPPIVILRVSARVSVNAWTCARRSTDRDLQCAFIRRSECLDMCLSEPTVILRRKDECLEKNSPRTTDHDPANAKNQKICNTCNDCNVCNFLAAVPFSIYKTVMSAFMQAIFSIFSYE